MRSFSAIPYPPCGSAFTIQMQQAHQQTIPPPYSDAQRHGGIEPLDCDLALSATHYLCHLIACGSSRKDVADAAMRCGQSHD